MVTNLFNNGVPIEEIKNVTGHKATKSVHRYIRHVSDSKKGQYSEALNQTLSAPLPATDPEFLRGRTNR